MNVLSGLSTEDTNLRQGQTNAGTTGQYKTSDCLENQHSVNSIAALMKPNLSDLGSSDLTPFQRSCNS